MKKIYVLLLSIVLLFVPLQTFAASNNVVTTVDQAILQMKKAFFTYNDAATTGKFADINEVYKQYNASKTAYNNAKAVVNKNAGSQKNVLISKLDMNYKTYITDRVIPYIDAYNYIVNYIQVDIKGLNEAITNSDLEQVQKYYHEISYQLKGRTAIIYRVYGKPTRDLLKAYKQEAQDLRDSMAVDVTVAMDLTKLEQLLIDGLNDEELKDAESAITSINQLLPNVTDSFKEKLTLRANELIAKYNDVTLPLAESVTAVNGKIAVTFNKEVIEIPVDLIVYKNGEAMEIDDSSVKKEGNKLEITVPTIERTFENQEIVYSIKLGEGVEVSGEAVIIEALVAPEVPVVTGLDGKVVNSAAPRVVPVEGVTYTTVLKKNNIPVPSYTLGSVIREEGVYELIITATHDGLTADTTVEFTVDTTAPALTFDTTEETVYENGYVVKGFLQKPMHMYL